MAIVRCLSHVLADEAFRSVGFLRANELQSDHSYVGRKRASHAVRMEACHLQSETGMTKNNVV